MVVPQEDQFVSRLFLVAKKDGNFRPVVNLKPLNSFVMKQHFKMEGSAKLKEGGLDVCCRFEGCISLRVSDTTTSAVSPLYVGQQHIRIHLPPLWTEQYAKNIYKITETSDGARQSTGSEK